MSQQLITSNEISPTSGVANTGIVGLLLANQISSISNTQITGIITSSQVDGTFVLQTSNTGAAYIPTGNTAQRPGVPAYGYLRYNTDLNVLENYTNYGWTKVSQPTPNINSISGNIYGGFPSNITITGTNFGIIAGVVTFTSGANTASVSVTPTNDTTLPSIAVPSAIYGLSGGTTIAVKFASSSGTTSAPYNITSLVIPTGGNSIVTNGTNRIHVFTSSGTFAVSNSISGASVLLVAGGGAGGTNAGAGGGAGGLISATNVNLSATSYTITVGSGGSSGGTDAAPTGSGTSSSGLGYTAVGGGGGINSNGVGGSGGSGGGSAVSGNAGGAGTAGQGNAGGAGTTADGANRSAGGGGGAGSVGQNSQSSSVAGTGGVGLTNSILPSANATSLSVGQVSGGSVYYAGGGGGACHQGAGAQFAGGLGGGGISGVCNYPTSGTGGTSGSPNTGGGGGAGSGGGYSGANGGSGVVIISYSLT